MVKHLRPENHIEIPIVIDYIPAYLLHVNDKVYAIGLTDWIRWKN